MKVLQVVHDSTIFGMGGSEIYTESLARELSREHDVRLFFTIPDDGGTEKFLEGNYKGIPYWALKKNPLVHDNPFDEYSRWAEKKFIQVIKKFKPNIIHFQHLMNLSLSLPLVAKKAGIPCCFTLHDYWLLCPLTIFLNSEMNICNSCSIAQCVDCTQKQIGYYPLSSEGVWPLRIVKRSVKRILNLKKRATAYFRLGIWRTYWVRKIFKSVNIFIAPSQFLQKRFIMDGLPPQKITFIRHGFDKIMFEGITRTSSPTLRFAFIGSMRAHKGINVLIDAFNRIEGLHELRMYGRISPSVKEDLYKRIKNHHILIMGELKDEDKRKVFADIDVLIVPSIWYENCQIVIHEAFMAKIPVITSNIGGMAELVKDGEGGVTFPVGDAEKLADKIKMFINDIHLRDHLASNIPEVKSMEIHAAEITKLYYSITRSSG